MIIFIDMDEVVADTQQRFIDWYEKDFGKKFSPNNFTNKHLSDIVPKEHSGIVSRYIYIDGFFRNLPVIKDSQEVIQLMTKNHEVFFLTAAMEFRNSFVDKYDWLEKNFPFVSWKNRIFCGSKKMVKGDVLIDDYAYNFNSFDGRKILFSSPHNASETKFERAHNWLDVKKLLAL